MEYKKLKRKEIELVDEFEKSGVDVLAITETKNKGKGIIKLNNNHILIYSGVENEERARAGVGCIIHSKMKKAIREWECINERIMTIKLDNITETTTNIIIIYGSDENVSKSDKDEYWEKLPIEFEKLEEQIYIMGDFNARVGNKINGLEDIMGPYGEMVKNSNGNRLIDFCIINGLKILNTLFQHKDIHKYTREENSRNERSIIDYFLINSGQRNTVKDVRVKRGFEIGSDHFLVTAKIKIKEKENKQMQEKPKKEIKITKYKIEKLKDKQTREKYQNNIKELIKQTPKPNMDDEEDMWKTFKYIITEATRNACGTIRYTNNRKQTHWWNEQVKEEVKKKKQKWKNYLNTKKEEDYEEYRLQRKKTKDVIKKSKESTWKEFGKTLETNFKENQKIFYRTLKINRNVK